MRHQIWLAESWRADEIHQLAQLQALQGLKLLGRETGRNAALWVPPSGYTLMCMLRIFWSAPSTLVCDCEIFLKVKKATIVGMVFSIHLLLQISTAAILNDSDYHKSFIFEQISYRKVFKLCCHLKMWNRKSVDFSVRQNFTLNS